MIVTVFLVIQELDVSLLVMFRVNAFLVLFVLWFHIFKVGGSCDLELICSCLPGSGGRRGVQG